MSKNIQTMVDFVGLEAGQIVRLFGRDALYLGLKLVETCVSAGEEIYNYFPHTLRAKSEGISGDIELVEIRSLGKLPSREILAPCIIHTIGKGHKEYGSLKKILIEARLIPEQALILNAFTTRSGMVVEPYWYYETDGRICFRDMAFVLDSSLPAKMHVRTGKFADTREEAWEKSKEWAEEN